MAEKLTPQQKMAVVDRGGRLLVSAAAGSGKTKVLVDRILGYLTDEQDPANLDDFLIITYTKAAASELRGKIAAKLTEAIAAQPENRHLQRQMQRLFLAKISTVHGFCADVLRQYAYRLDISADFRVADESECRELREQVLTELLDRAYEQAGTDADFRAFVDSQGLGRDDRLVAEIILKVYDSARCHLDPEQWLQKCQNASDVEAVEDAGETLWGRFLMDELFSYLDCQLKVLRKCADEAERIEQLKKPAVNLRETVLQLEHLRAAKTWDEVVQRKKINYGLLTFPKKDVDAELIDRLRACRNACKKDLEKYLRNFSEPSSAVLKDLEASAAATRGLIALVRQFGEAYDQAKRIRRCLDFGDLEHKMLDLVLGVRRSGPTALAREIGQRFREIMVDEYQDSNGVQDAIFMALTGERNNCFMVGDVKQSIYQFRLADPGIFLEKYQQYVPAEEAKLGAGRKVLLSANFRSGAEVIEGVNAVFADCMSPKVGGLDYGEDEMLREGIPHDKIPDPAVEFYGLQVRESTYEEEASFVAARIHQMINQGTLIRGKDGFRPVTPDDIVILLRSPGSMGQRFKLALEKLGIRCTSGGGTDLLKTQEISTLRSLLQTVANPRQDIPLISTLASPVFGFTSDELAGIRSRRKKGSVYDALLEDIGEKSGEFIRILNLLRKSARMNRLTQLVNDIFTLTRMDSIFAAMDGGEGKAANLQTFYGIISDYESASGQDLVQFLNYLDSLEDRGLKTEGEETGGAVTIMSIHKSKGLEFPVVFLCGLSREFNRESLRAQVLCDKTLGLGLSVADSANRVRYPAISKRAIVAKTAAESLSEEMRVLYVAMTRARDRLIMTYASKTLQGDIQDLALRYDMSGPELLTRDVVCPGEWVLLSALLRTEAGQLHNLGGKPSRTHISDYPWLIQVAEAPVLWAGISMEENEVEAVSADTVEKIQKSLEFCYAHVAATRTPSKQTATERKGRLKDNEAAENADAPKKVYHKWRRPSFAAPEHSGKTYGNALHAAMQYVRYDRCNDPESVRAEILRLTSEGFLTRDQAEMVDCNAIADFFRTEMGQKLRNGVPCIREFKFSILDEGSNYSPGLEGEQVLLQGVVDCALLEDDGITILDFKTDRVTEETLANTVEGYRGQVETYAHAIGRIYGKPIKASYLYFFRMNRFVRI